MQHAIREQLCQGSVLFGHGFIANEQAERKVGELRRIFKSVNSLISNCNRQVAMQNCPAGVWASFAKSESGQIPKKSRMSCKQQKLGSVRVNPHLLASLWQEK